MGKVNRMRTALVGYTGFVGSNLMEQHQFDCFYNSKNILQSYETRPDLLIYAGVRAEKFIANREPLRDRRIVEEAFHNMKMIQPEKLVLISTVDVYNTPVNVNEDTRIKVQNLQPYGANRYWLEQAVRREWPNATIIRLPALFGSHIKKNFIFDFLNSIPSMLKPEKFKELSGREPRLSEYYQLNKSGFYQCRTLEKTEREELKFLFSRLRFSALNFTDSRSVFQFYPLKRLWGDIEIILKNELRILNLATEPVSACEVYRFLSGTDFINELDGAPVYYNYVTKYAELFGRQGNYILEKAEVLSEIREFTEGALNETGGI